MHLPLQYHLANLDFRLSYMIIIITFPWIQQLLPSSPSCRCQTNFLKAQISLYHSFAQNLSSLSLGSLSRCGNFCMCWTLPTRGYSWIQLPRERSWNRTSLFLCGLSRCPVPGKMQVVIQEVEIVGDVKAVMVINLLEKKVKLAAALI